MQVSAAIRYMPSLEETHIHGAGPIGLVSIWLHWRRWFEWPHSHFHNVKHVFHEVLRSWGNIYLLQFLTAIASNNDAYWEISFYFSVFNEDSCFVCLCIVSGMNYSSCWACSYWCALLYIYQVNQLQWLLNQTVSIFFLYLGFIGLVLL